MDFSPTSRLGRRGQLVLELTPLVDVIFQLLIFFLLTATFVKNPNFEINLPKASSKLTTNVKKDLTIVVTRDGRFKYEAEEVDEDELEGIFEEEFEQNPSAIILIRADTDSRHGKVVEVMDLAKKVGFTRLGIAVRIQD
jgi:biopolymer transport protein ExbD/biopolymer transport protein TolR